MHVKSNNKKEKTRKFSKLQKRILRNKEQKRKQKKKQKSRRRKQLKRKQRRQPRRNLRKKRKMNLKTHQHSMLRFTKRVKVQLLHLARE